MLYLATTASKLQVVTSAAVATHVHASFVDLTVADGSVAPGAQNTIISTATTTDVVAVPGSGIVRSIKAMTVRNAHASTAQDVTVVIDVSATDYEVIKVTLPAGYTLHYHEHAGWWVTDTRGAKLTRTDGLISPAVSTLNLVVLASDVTNNNASANTIANVTGLSFSVVAGETYWFLFTIAYTAAATTTGSRWSISGPGSPTLLHYTSEYTLAATTQTINSATAYDIPAACNATSLTAGNVATIEGIIKPSSDGTVIARFASEVSGSAIVAKAGSLLQWVRTL